MKRIFAAVLICMLLGGCAVPDNITTVSVNGVDDLDELIAEEAAENEASDSEEELVEEHPEETQDAIEEEAIKEETAEIEEEIEEEAAKEEAKEPGDITDAVIWALVDLEIYDEEGNVTGSFLAGDSAIVISFEEESGMFETAEGYVDSSYCMINLPDYLGNLVSFNITNAKSSIFTIAGVSVEGITGTVLEGYEGRTADTYVPLLFPTAQKLLAAAEAARDAGYTLQIVEAYRPYAATRYLYDTVTDLLYEEALEGETYYSLMTNNGEYMVSAFLAKTRSSHNYGVALDLQLLGEDGNVVPAQSAIHDLSYNSALVYNNENADILAEIMTGAGFETLFSEWWHFQDNDAYDVLKNESIDTAELSLKIK